LLVAGDPAANQFSKKIGCGIIFYSTQPSKKQCFCLHQAYKYAFELNIMKEILHFFHNIVLLQ